MALRCGCYYITVDSCFFILLNFCRALYLCAAGAKNVEQFFLRMSRQMTEHEWTVVKSAADEYSQLAMFYRHWV